jgi:hypothetical protein
MRLRLGERFGCADRMLDRQVARLSVYVLDAIAGRRR